MKRILVAVDDTKASIKTVEKVADFFGGNSSENITLLYVQRMGGMSVLDDILPVGPELEELKSSIHGTELQDKLDMKADRILQYYQNFLKENEINGISVIAKIGHPADEIVATAKELKSDLIVIGSRSQRFHNIFLGSVSREVVNNAEISVLIVK